MVCLIKFHFFYSLINYYLKLDVDIRPYMAYLCLTIFSKFLLSLKLKTDGQIQKRKHF